MSDPNSERPGSEPASSGDATPPAWSPSGSTESSAAPKAAESLHKAQEASKQAYVQAKEATATAKNAFITLLSDPVGGQKTAIASLGQGGTLQSGIVFVSAFVLSLFFAALFGANALGPFAGGGIGSGMVFRSILSGILTAAGLFGAIWLAAKLTGKKPLSLVDGLFTTGVCLIPATISILAGILFVKMGLWSVALGLSVMALSLLVLLVNASLTQLAEVPTKTAFFLTPVVLLASTLLVRLVS